MANFCTAVLTLFRYAALRHPEHAAVIERVLAIPPKRFERRLVTSLTEAEVDALLAAPDRATWTGRRDTALIGLADQTGLRASELIGPMAAGQGRGAFDSRTHWPNRGEFSSVCATRKAMPVLFCAPCLEWSFQLNINTIAAMHRPGGAQVDY